MPLGEIYLPTDPPRMFRAIKATKKPCLAYKVLAAGRRIGSPPKSGSASRRPSPTSNPSDAAIVGMYQQFGDQVAENSALVRELASKA